MKTAKLIYEKHGYRTVPVSSVEKKIPALKGWPKPDFEWDADTIPFKGIGIATGKHSNITVVDFDDPEKHGTVPQSALDAHNKLKGFLLNKCSVAVRTQHGGIHCYFKYDERLGQKQGIIKGVDVRSDGGYVVAPPTPGYTFIKGEISAPLALLPYEEIMVVVGAVKPDKKVITEEPKPKVIQQTANEISNTRQLIPEGQREQQVCSVFGRYKAAGLSTDESLAAFDAKYELEYGEEWTRDYLVTKVRHFWSEGTWEDKPTSLRGELMSLLTNNEINQFDRNLGASSILLPHIYMDREYEPYIIEKEDAMPLPPKVWLEGTGIGRSKAADIAGVVSSQLAKKRHGQVLVDYFYYDRDIDAVYFNTDEGIIRVSSEGVTTCDRPKHIYFRKKYPYRRNTDRISDFVGALNLDRDRTPDALAEGLIKCWPVSVLLNLSQRAFLVIEGERAAGKTTLAEIIARSIVPDTKAQLINKKDLYLQLSNTDICLLDNVEANYSDEVKDILSVGSTGGDMQTRKHYENRDTIYHSLSAHVIITSIGCKFLSRSDIASRVIPIHLKLGKDSLYSAIDVNRWASALFFEVLDLLPKALRNREPYIDQSLFRNVEFASMCSRCGFDLEAYHGQVEASQVMHGEQDLISDIFSVMSAKPNSNGFLRAGQILALLVEYDPEKYSKLSCNQFGPRLKKLVNSNSFKNKLNVDVKKSGANHMYSFC